MKRLPDVTRVPDLKRMILQGWELCFLKHPRYPKLPGPIEMRYRDQVASVTYECIDRAVQNLDWFRENTEEIELPKGAWLYRAKQKDLVSGLIGSSAGGLA